MASLAATCLLALRRLYAELGLTLALGLGLSIVVGLALSIPLYADARFGHSAHGIRLYPQVTFQT